MSICSSVVHSKLLQFHFAQKYCDVEVRIQNTYFPCHRVVLASASEYFDAAFGGEFIEKDVEVTVLHDVDVETFKEFLKYAYSGEMCTVTTSNVVDFLRASLFLGIPSLQEVCTNFIYRNLSSISELVHLFAFLRCTNLTAMLHTVTGFIVKNFRLFYDDEWLLELAFDDLEFLLKRWSEDELPLNHETSLLYFLIRWIQHAPDKRMKYSIKLIGAVDIESVSPDLHAYVMQFFKDFVNQPDVKELPLLNFASTMEGSSESFAGSEVIPASLYDPKLYEDVLGLHVTVEYRSVYRRKNVPLEQMKSREKFVGAKVFAFNKYYPDWVFSETGTWQTCTRRTVVQESTNLLYCVESFWPHQTFCTYSSPGLTSVLNVLTPPPVPLEEHCFNMCSTSRNTIYLVSDKRSQFSTSYPEESVDFFRYDCLIDKWIRAPTMRDQKFCSLICADDNLIYSIGGTIFGSNSVQAYDYRSGKWMVLPGCTYSRYSTRIANCACVLNNEVFVAHWCCPFGIGIECYDSVAGKWRTTKYSRRDDDYFNLHMIPFENRLWFLSLSRFNRVRDTLSSYGPITQDWHESDLLHNAICNGIPNKTDDEYWHIWDVKDVITFKARSS